VDLILWIRYRIESLNLPSIAGAHEEGWCTKAGSSIEVTRINIVGPLEYMMLKTRACIADRALCSLHNIVEQPQLILICLNMFRRSHDLTSSWRVNCQLCSIAQWHTTNRINIYTKNI